MRILYIGFNPRFYGNFRRMSQLGKLLAERGHEVTLLTTSLSKHHGVTATDFWGFRLVETPDLFSGPLRSGWDPWNTLNRIAWLKNQSFDIVHAFESRPVVIYPALWMSRRKHIPLLIDWADWFGKGGSVEERPGALTRAILRPVETYYENHFRPLADANTVISSELYRKAVELGISTDHIFQMPDGGDSQAIQPVETSMAKAQSGFSSEQAVVGYLGSMFLQDARFVAEAWGWVIKKYPSACLFWFGARPQPSIDLLKDLPGVRIVGRFPQEQMSTFLSANDLAWLPLRNSAANRGRWPSKLNEYLCAGLPVVATKVGDVQGLFSKYDFGLLCREDPREFAERTVELLGNKNERRRLGINARWVAEHVLDWKQIAFALEDFYSRVLKKDH